MKLRCAACVILVLVTLAAPAACAEAPSADQVVPDAPAGIDTELAPASGDPMSGTRRLLILCGHPGDEEHRVLYSDTVDRLREALTTRFGFDAEAANVYFGTQEMLTDGGPAPRDVGGACTRENLASAAEELGNSLQAEDALWVIVVGHGYFDGLHSHFNLSGPDVDQEGFAGMFEGLACRELVFWITIPASGFYIRPLAEDGRVVITATEVDRETNETIFPHMLADVLAEPPPKDELDVDGDGALSLFDLYIGVSPPHRADLRG